MRIGPADYGRLAFNLSALRFQDRAGALSGVIRTGQNARGLAFGRPLAASVTVRSAGYQQGIFSSTQRTAASQSPLGQLQSLVLDIRGLQNVKSSQSAVPQPSAIADVGAASTTPARSLDRRSRVESRTVITGVNSSKIVGASVQRLPSQPALTIQGEVTSAARAALLTVRGGNEANVTAGGIYQLSGSRGSTTLTLQAGESLHDVAARINGHTAVTGVAAEVSGSDLALSSIDVGGAAVVHFEPIELEYATEISGVNAAQIGSFQVASLTTGASETISGELVSTVQDAELVYRGADGGVVAGTASFRLSGSRGAASVAITAGESLATVAQRINQDTATTGVVASVSGNDLRLTSDTTGDDATVKIDSIVRQYDVSESSVNPAEIADFRVISLFDGSEHVLSGEVTRSATSADIALQGSAGGTVIDTATFELSGALGAATISITQGESLSAVANRVNAVADSTGVVADVAGDQLVFSSSDIGSSAHTEIQLTHVNHTTQVSGVNSQQLTNFEVNSINEGASQTISGSITQAAEVAELAFEGTFLGRVGTRATFTLSGVEGSAEFSVTNFQSLANLASEVNAVTASTGVSAIVQGTQIKFRSVALGSAATVAINVTSGSFPVTGGNGNGTANGTDAVAVVNGQTITGVGNEFTFSDSVGSYSFTSASDFTGAFSSVSIVSQAGSFDLSGGNGDGTATGLDALAVINGTELTGVANRFVFSEPGGQFELEFAADFAGEFSPISVQSVAQPFDIEGGDESGLSAGADAVAVINGVEHASADGQFEVQGAHGVYEIEFAFGFTGDFDAISVASVAQQLDIEGGVEPGRAVGSDAQAVINGQLLTGEKSLFSFAVDGQQVTLEFQSGFAGEFDAFTATTQTRTVTESVRSWRPIAEKQMTASNEASENSGNHVPDPLTRLQEEISGLAALAQQIAPVETGATPPARGPLTKSTITSQLFAALDYNGSITAYRQTDPPLAGTLARIRQLIDLRA
jgi:hypothetical protein